MFQKKGQISLYVIMGIVILISISFILYINSKSIEKSDYSIKSIYNFEASTASIKNFIDLCLKNTASEAIDYVAKHGGYYSLQDVYSTNSSLYNTAYYYYLGNNFMPSKERVEKEISKYVDDNLFFCLQDFFIFKQQGIYIESGYTKSVTKLGVKNSLISLDLPLTITQKLQRKTLTTFEVNMYTKLGSMLDSALALTKEQVNDTGNICMSCIFKEAVKNNFIIELFNINNDTVIISILDNSTSQKLIYANKYQEISCKNVPINWAEERINKFLSDCIKLQIEGFKYTLKINEIPDLTAISNVPFVYDVNATVRANFTDYTNLFEINTTTGLINFTSSEQDIGNYVIWINAVDSLGNEDFESFSLRILKE